MKKCIFLLLLVSVALMGCSPRITTSVTVDQETQKFTIQQSILSPESIRKDELVEVRENESALSVLQRTHKVTVKHFSFGDIADAIDGISGTDGKYWIFYVNGQMSQVGAGEYKVQKGDVIIWKFQKENEGI